MASLDFVHVEGHFRNVLRKIVPGSLKFTAYNIFPETRQRYLLMIETYITESRGSEKNQSSIKDIFDLRTIFIKIVETQHCLHLFSTTRKIISHVMNSDFPRTSDHSMLSFGVSVHL